MPKLRTLRPIFSFQTLRLKKKSLSVVKKKLIELRRSSFTSLFVFTLCAGFILLKNEYKRHVSFLAITVLNNRQRLTMHDSEFKTGCEL